MLACGSNGRFTVRINKYHHCFLSALRHCINMNQCAGVCANKTSIWTDCMTCSASVCGEAANPA